MTGMLASVCNINEAKLVQEVSVDIIDLKNPRVGALGALDFGIIKEIVEYINGVTPISATIGDLPFAAEVLEPVICQMALTGVDIIKIGVFDKINGAAEYELLSRLSRQGIRIVLVMFAEQYESNYDFENLAETGITGVMLDTMNKNSGPLLKKLPVSALQQFVRDANSYGLLTGLAGSLGEKDIAALLDINPDYLGFRGGLCRQGIRENVLDKEMTNKVRQKIPVNHAKIVQSMAVI